MPKKILPTKFDDNQLVPTRTSSIRSTVGMQNTNPTAINRSSNKNTSAALKTSNISPCTNYNLGDNCFSFCSNQDVFVNITENITEQKYIKNIEGAGALCAGTINSSNVYTNIVNNVCKLGFDTDSGFEVTDLGNGLSKIQLTALSSGVSSLNSLTGAVNLSAGSNITIGASGNTLTVCSTSTATPPSGCNTQIQYNNSGAFAGSCGLTYDSTTCSLGLTKITVPEGQSLAVTMSNQDASWYSLYGDFSLDVQEDYASQVQYDSQGNIYIIGADGNDGIPYLTKYDSLGTILWQFNFTESNNYYKTGDAVAIDSSDNVYCAVGTDDSITNATIFKITSSGNIVWQTTLNGSGIRTASDLVVDGSGNVYACVYVGYPEPDNATIVKLNSLGVIQWQKSFAAESMYPQGISIDTSGNVLVVAKYAILPSYDYVLGVIKLNSAGTLIWQKQYSYQGVSAGQITTDSSNNIYVVGKTTPLEQYGLIMKLNSTGTILWEVNIPPYPGAYPQPYFTGVALDSSNNVYVSGYANSGAGLGGSDLLIFKLDNSGNILWQRAFSGAGGDNQYWYWAIKTIDVFNNKYVVTGYTNSPASNNSEAITIQFPTDGSLTGTYSNFSYVSTSFVPATTPLTEATGTTTESTGTLTSASGVYSLSTATNINTLVKTSGGINIFNITSEGSFATPNYTLPFGDGISGQFLTTNGSGTLSWDVPIPGLDYSCNIAIRSCGNSTINGFNNVAIGKDTLYCNTIGGNNVAIGCEALYSNTTNGNNLGIGAFALRNNTTGTHNVAIGYGAQLNNNGSNMNIGIGYDTLKNICSSNDNIALGGGSQFSRITGSHNVSLGYGTQKFSLSGGDNISIGADSQRCNICGFENISMGSRSLYCNTTGNNNIAIGVLSMYHNVHGEKNVAIGFRVLENNTTGNYSVAIGQYAGFLNRSATITAIGEATLSNNTTGLSNVAVGSHALNANTTGSYNTGVGFNALAFNTIGGHNIALGYEAYKFGSTGNQNVAIGSFALTINVGCGNIAIGFRSSEANTTGNGSIAIGAYAAQNNRASQNIAIGDSSLSQNTTGIAHVAIGSGALQFNTTGSYNTAIGNLALLCNTIGSCNFALGESALRNNSTGCANVAIGVLALEKNSVGSHNVAIGGTTLYCNTSGNGNIALGQFSMWFNTTGSNNVAIGCSTLQQNTFGNRNVAIGNSASFSNTSGNGNTAIGDCAGCNNTIGCNNTFIGMTALGQTATSINTIVLGNSSISCIRAQVTTISALSDQRDKTNVQDLPLGLQFILDLRPVKFTWNMRDGGKVGVDDTGFIAQEVLSVEDKYNVAEYLDMVGRENPEKLEIKPAKLIPILVKAIQELSDKVDRLQNQVNSFID